MQQLKDFLSSNLPSTFKDARLTLEAVLGHSSLPDALSHTSAYAVAVSLGMTTLSGVLKATFGDIDVEQAEVAVSIMGQTNIYYSFLDTAPLPGLRNLPAQLRMVAYGQQSAQDKLGFEAAALAVSIVGKCKPCITSHVEELQKLGFTDEQFRDLARLCASLNAVSKMLNT